MAINYRQHDFVSIAKEVTDGRGADVVLDHIGAMYLARNVDALATEGRLVVIGLQGGRGAATRPHSRSKADEMAIVAAPGTARMTVDRRGAGSLRHRPDDADGRRADRTPGVEAGDHVGTFALTL